MDRVMGRWIARARHRVEISIDVFAPASDIVRDLWIQWHIPPDGDVDILDLEAMELLELLARADNLTAWFIILGLVGQSAFCDMIEKHALSNQNGPVYPRFVVHNVQFLHAAGTLQKFARWLALPIDSTDHSPAYQSVYAMLMKMYPARNGKRRFVRGPEDRIPVKFHVDLQSGAKVLEELASIAAFAQREKQADRSKLFELVGLVPRWRDGVVTDANLQSFQSFVTSHDLQVEHLPLASAKFAEDQVSPQAISDFLHRMVLAADRKNCPTSVSLGPTVSVGVFQAVLSALLTTQSVKFVHSKPFEKEADHDQFWAWLAYAMFSRDSRNSIQRLDLDAGKLKDAHVDIIERILKAQDPLAYLSPTKSLDRDPVIVDVSADATLLVRLDADTEHDVSLKTDRPLVSLRVVDDSSDQQSVCAIYPGVGLCWVDRKHIVAQRTMETMQQPTATSIERIGLDLTQETSLDALLRLLKLVSPGLKTLGIRCFTSYLFIENSVLEELLAACPNVSRLELMHLEVTNFKWLPTEGLRSLSLDSVDVLEPSAYQMLMEDLSSRRIVWSQLHMQATEETFEPLEEPMIQLLESNTILERLFIASNTDDLDQMVPPSLREELEERHLAPINVQESPLPLRSKLAFLSAIQPPKAAVAEGRHLRSKRKRPSLPELDAALIGNIFQYAAPHKLRLCGEIGFKESW